MIYSLRSRLVATFTLLLVIPFTVMLVILSGLFNNEFGQSIEASTSQTMDQYAGFINTMTIQLEDVANQLISNELTQRWATARLNTDLSTESRLVLEAELRKFLSSIALNHSTISSITIFHENGNAVGIRDQVYRDPSYHESEWYQNYAKADRRWVPAHHDLYQPGYLREESVNSLLFPLIQLQSFKKAGLFKVNFPTALIQDPLDKIHFGETGRVYLLDWKGHSVLNQNISGISQVLKEGLKKISGDRRSGGILPLDNHGTTHLIFFRKLETEDWILVGEVPKYEFYQKLTVIRYILLGVTGILLLITIVAAFWLSSGIARPLSHLAEAMRLVERGDFTNVEKMMSSRIQPKRNDVGFLITVFRNMARKLQYLIETEFQSNLRRRDAEYKALLMQINPHFLYNTLEVIGGLAAQGHQDKVVDATESLGSMLRLSLRLDSDLVELREELEYIKYYVKILKIRFGDRFNMEIEESASDGRVMIVKFILQPLLENAVKYTLEHIEVANVRIVVRKNKGILQIEVQDNGIGMPSKLIEELMLETKKTDRTDVLSSQGKRIGLRNVLARCRLYYGDRFQFKIHSEPEKGTNITLILPISEGQSDV
ncbi:MAG TPA: sensor histidine kinase [Bacilli bacterium]